MKKPILILTFLFVICGLVFAADMKITELPTATSVTTSDIVPVVVNPNVTPRTKKTQIGNILENASLTVAGTTNEIDSSAAQQNLKSPRTWTLSLSDTLDLSDKNMILPLGTSLTTADCDNDSEAGRIFVDSDATTGRRVYVCEGAANGWVLQGGVGALTASKWCVADGTGTEIVCDQDNPGGGAGIVTAVGDCTGGDCLDGTSDGGTWLKFYDIDGAGQLINGNLTAARVWTMPDATGTVALTTSTVAAATSATALAANGTNCSAGYAPLGVDTAGAVEGCFQVMTQGKMDTSTELRAIVTDETGTGSLVFNTAPTFSGTVTAGAFVGDGSGLTGLATNFTTSAELLGFLTDEVGTGFAVFNDSPVFTTILTMPSGTAPEIDSVGKTALDTNFYATGRGAIVTHDGTSTTALVGVLGSDAPLDGQVPQYNTGGTITWENPATSGITVSDTEVLFGDGANSPAGDPGFTYNKTTNVASADGFTTTSAANPKITFKDANATAGDDNAYVDVNCTNVVDGSEDCDMYFTQQRSGSDVTFMTADASAETVLVPNLNNTYYIDGITYAKTSTGIQAALTDLGTNDGAIILPCGSYLFTDTVTIDIASGQHFMMEGMGNCTYLYLDSGVNKDMINITGSSAQYWKIGRFRMDGNKATNSAGDGIEVNTDIGTDANAYMYDIYIEDVKNDAIELTAGTDVREIHFDHIVAYDNDGYGIVLNGTDHKISNSIFAQGGLSGMYINGGANQIVNTKAFGNGDLSVNPNYYPNIEITSSAGLTHLVDVEAQDGTTDNLTIAGDYTVITGSMFQGAGYGNVVAGDWAGIRIANTGSNSTIVGNQIYGFGSPHYQDYGIVLDDGVENCRIIGNDMMNNNTAAISFETEAEKTNNEVFGNTFGTGETQWSYIKETAEIRGQGITAATVTYPLVVNAGEGIETPNYGGAGIKLQLGEHPTNDVNKFVGLRALATGSWGNTSILSITTAETGTQAERAQISYEGLRVLPPTYDQDISAGETIDADACGTIKQIYSTGSVTTNTTDTFTTPGATNEGCCMDVVNIDSTDTITLDSNANFVSAGGADVSLGPYDSVRVCSNGTDWYQISAALAAAHP